MRLLTAHAPVAAQCKAPSPAPSAPIRARLQAGVGNQAVLRHVAQIHEAAHLGTSGASGPLPHLGAIQRSFGRHDLSRVAAHIDGAATAGSVAMGAAGFATGDHVAFSGAPSLHTAAHEAAHAIQQRDGVRLAGGVGQVSDRYEQHAEAVADLVVAGRSAEALLSSMIHPGAASAPPGEVVQRDLLDNENKPSETAAPPPSSAPKAHSCPSTKASCPKDFCVPFDSEADARSNRALWLNTVLAGITAAVDHRVVPLWYQHIMGGAPPQDFSAKFGADFTRSRDTHLATEYLLLQLNVSLRNSPPVFPPDSNSVTIDLGSRIGPAIAELDKQDGPHEMNFGQAAELPGNIAGGVGKDQLSCPAGAQPSPFNDERRAEGTATVTRAADGALTLTPSITYTVKDTIDLCPGDCGGSGEQIATRRISRWEATGISGDVPFTVVFPNPPAESVIPARRSAPPTPPVTAPPPPKKE
jgi:hypothetical protein